MESLPDELMLHIMLFLDECSLASLGLTNSYHHKLFKSNEFWKANILVIYPWFNRSCSLDNLNNSDSLTNMMLYREIRDLFNKIESHISYKEIDINNLRWDSNYMGHTRLNCRFLISGPPYCFNLSYMLYKTKGYMFTGSYIRINNDDSFTFYESDLIKEENQKPILMSKSELSSMLIKGKYRTYDSSFILQENEYHFGVKIGLIISYYLNGKAT